MASKLDYMNLTLDAGDDVILSGSLRNKHIVWVAMEGDVYDIIKTSLFGIKSHQVHYKKVLGLGGALQFNNSYDTDRRVTVIYKKL